MSTAIYLKLTSSDYFKSFPQALTYVRAASHTSNGFQLMYRILELVHPRLRQAKGGIHKQVHVPLYSDVEDDSIYTFLTQYQNYLLYEKLSPENRSYNQSEQTMFILSALRHDERLRPGINYVESVLRAYQRDSRLNPSIPFPLELQFEEIGVVLDEHSDNYTVGEKSSVIRSAFNSDAINGLAFKATDTPKIHALRPRQQQSKPYRSHDSRRTKTDRPEYSSKQGKSDNTKSCRACLSIGHCITSGDICYPLAKATLCHTFLSNKDNEDLAKRNVYNYRKERKEKRHKAKTTSRMRGVIHQMYASGKSEEEITPIIHLAQAMEDTSDDDESDSDASEYHSE